MKTVVRLALAVGILQIVTIMPAHADKDSLAGRWHLAFYGKCVITPANRRACSDLQSPAEFAVFDVPGSTLIVAGSGDYFANAKGEFTVSFVNTIIESTPHGRKPLHCSNALVFEGTFTGTCVQHGFGHGHIGKGHATMNDFIEDDASGWWEGTPPSRFLEVGTVDTNNPACPGVFDTTRFMATFGYKVVPKGVSARLVLVHHRA